MNSRQASSKSPEDEALDTRSISVFINCPFDAEYLPIFNALIFTIVCCGFIPRSAIETGSTGIARIIRILEAMNDSKYSIHDLSRCKGEGDYNLARFNMPLELGMAMNQGHLNRSGHEWFVLVPANHDYVRYVSDLAGFDFKYHDGTVETVLPPVMAWLLTRPEAVGYLEPPDVLAALPKFNAEVDRLTVSWSGEVPWPRLIKAARQSVPI